MTFDGAFLRTANTQGVSVLRNVKFIANLLLTLTLGLLVLGSNFFDDFLDNFLLIAAWLAISDESVGLDQADELAISLKLLEDLPGNSERDLVPFGELARGDELGLWNCLLDFSSNFLEENG